MYDRLVEVDDEGEPAGVEEVLGGLAVDAAGLFEGDGGAVGGVGHLYGGAGGV